jgi:hypothetical protein
MLTKTTHRHTLSGDQAVLTKTTERCTLSGDEAVLTKTTHRHTLSGDEAVLTISLVITSTRSANCKINCHKSNNKKN